jgi:hypothetical protein
MKKIKAFIYVYTRSLTNFAYYRDVLKTGFGFSVKYYLFLALLASVITSIAVSIRVIPETSRTFGSLIYNARNAFPDDLVFTIKNGEWSINRPEPFIVPMPKFGNEGETQDTQTPKNLVVFYNNGTIEDLKNLDTLVVFNKVNVIYRENNKISVMPIKDLPDNVINKAEFDKFVSAFASILRLLPLLIVLVLFLAILAGNIIFRAFYFAWFSLFVWLASKIVGVKLGYNESARIAIHSATLPLTLGTLFGALGVNPFPFWFGLLNLLFALFVLRDMSKFNKNQT